MIVMAIFYVRRLMKKSKILDEVNNFLKLRVNPKMTYISYRMKYIDRLFPTFFKDRNSNILHIY